MLSFVQVRVIVYDWDKPDEVKDALLRFFEGIDLKKIKIEEKKGKGLVSSEVIIYTVKLNKRKLIEKFIENLKKYLDDEEKNKILEDFDKICDGSRVYLRFDKDIFIRKKKLVFVDHGEVFHIVLSFSVYPQNKEKVREELMKLLYGTDQNRC